MKVSHFVSLALSLALGTSLAAQERLTPKQLAGPIDEIRTGAMAPVDPIATAVHSKSAMIPVDLVQSASGTWRWDGTIAVDSEAFNMVLFSGEESWTVHLGRADAKSVLVPAHKLATRVERSELDFGDESFPGDYYQFTGVRPGEWTVAVEADAPARSKGYLLVSSDSSYRLLSYKTTDAQWVGHEIGFVSYGYEQAEGVLAKARGGMVREASMRVTNPDGREVTQAMFDDGRHGDERAGDGIFGGSFTAAQAGEHHVQVTARGLTPDGQPFVRTAEHVVPVVIPQVEFTTGAAASRLVDGNRLQVSLPVYNAAMAPEKYRLFAEVWGADENGEMRGVSWIGGMSYVEDGALNLGLDLRWIGLSGARGDFELRNVRIEDPDTFIPVLRAERMALSMTELPEVARTLPKSVDREMLVGPRPGRVATKAGGKLLLVHGYCSGNVWGGVAGQFSDYAIFQDFNQNRSHDQFAVLVGTFGAAYPSFGVVAHSQGGAAALHLYTYYWSGLDYASAGRLIQSVGTPYQGTALAGNAAVLGQIFGVGCGTNYDLTYSGASSWLSGIPTWARGEVNYYTTAFKDYWWSYDYCHLVTDLLLSDPDDGTTEKSKGQLSYAVNRGHKSGWCHTTGMEEPPQYTDSSRNSTMNTYAAR